MKIIAFFSEKGGVGKSTFSLMLASFLKYKHGIKVGVADFNKRLTEYRNDEVNYLKNEGLYSPEIQKNAWPIIPVDSGLLHRVGKNNPGNAIWLHDIVTEGEYRDMDVVIADLPGSISGEEILQLVQQRMVNLVIIPFDKEQQALSSALSVKNFLKKVPTCKFCGFFNMIQTAYGNKGEYVRMMKILEGAGLPVLPDMVSFSERMKHFEKVDMMRSTFSYPDWDSPIYSGSKDLGIENLLIDILREMQKVPDYKNTKPADLSFVSTLSKDVSTIQALNRQLNGTSFAEYEVKLPEDMKTKFKKNR
jgi:cellulose biosynthesis protein BcsQ